MSWQMNKVPDMNFFNTAGNGYFGATAVGYNARWETFFVNRDLFWDSDNGKFTATLKGKADFDAGVLHASSPIITDINFTYDMADSDFEGTFKKVLAGKEYSITFPRGSFKVPTIKIGA